MSTPDPNAPPPDPDAAPPKLPHHTDAYLAETKGPTILATCITLCVLSTVFVFARLFTRQKLMGKMNSDDYMVGVSIVSISPSFHLFELKRELSSTIHAASDTKSSYSRGPALRSPSWP